MRETMFMPEKPVQIPEYPDLKRKGALPAYLKYFWRDLVLLMVFLASMGIMQLLNYPIGTVRSLEIPFDSKIPLWPWTALIYNIGHADRGSAFSSARDRALYRRYLITMIWVEDGRRYSLSRPEFLSLRKSVRSQIVSKSWYYLPG